jgi:hypothetical protein
MKKILFVLMVFVVFSCKNESQDSKKSPSGDGIVATSNEGDKVASEGEVILEKLWETENTLTTAESVLFDEKKGLYYVSCIGGVPPTKEDGDGFIAVLDQRGNIVNKSLVSGLDAPKGMALNDGKLYVTDINEFVIIDIETGIMQRIAIQGAQFLNDAALAPDGSVYFTDTNTNTIHQYVNGGVKSFLQDDALSNPNGIYIDGNTMYVASFSNGDFYSIDMATKSITKKASNAFPGGDGVEPWQNGFLISNWNGEVYHSDAAGNNNKVLDTKEAKMNAADIMINQKSGELLVPTFFGNTVAAYKIVSKG